MLATETPDATGRILSVVVDGPETGKPFVADELDDEISEAVDDELEIIDDDPGKTVFEMDELVTVDEPSTPDEVDDEISGETAGAFGIMDGVPDIKALETDELETVIVSGNIDGVEKLGTPDEGKKPESPNKLGDPEGLGNGIKFSSPEESNEPGTPVDEEFKTL